MYQLNWLKEVFTPIGLFAILAAMLVFVLLTLIIGVPEPDHHVHADIALFVNGERFDLTTPSEVSVQPCVITDEGEGLPPQHLVYSSNGMLIHSFHPEITYANFFSTLGMQFEDTLFVDDQGNQFEENELKEFRFFVNNQEVDSLATTTISDLDRVLISYGEKNRDDLSISAELSELGSEACLASVICEDIREEINPCIGLSFVERVLYVLQSWF